MHRGAPTMRYLALLRGVNVGGVVLKMDELRGILLGLGLDKVTTYIQSGNAIFETARKDAAALETAIAAAIGKEKGLDISVMVRTSAEAARIAAVHPFATGDNEKALYVTVLGSTADPKGLAEISGLKDVSERFEGRDGVVYGLYGAGYGRSKYTNTYLERKLKVACTTRNWTTMRQLVEILEGRG